MNPHVEKELHFAFPDSVKWEKFDKEGLKLPVGIKLVDLVIERDTDILLVEIKDPSDTKAVADKVEHHAYLKRLKEGSVITDELTPKIRDSYTCLHLMERDNKILRYIVILEIASYKLKPRPRKALLVNFKDELLRDIRKETDQPWKKIYLKDCAVMTVAEWNIQYPDWLITRTPQVGAN